MLYGRYVFKHADAHGRFVSEIYMSPYHEAYEEAAKSDAEIRLDSDTLKRLLVPDGKKINGSTLIKYYKGLCKYSPDPPITERFPTEVSFLDEYWDGPATNKIAKIKNVKPDVPILRGEDEVIFYNNERKHSKEQGTKPNAYWHDAKYSVRILGTLMKTIGGLPDSRNSALKSLEKIGQKVKKGEMDHLKVLLINPFSEAYRIYVEAILQPIGRAEYSVFKDPRNYALRALELEKRIAPGEVRYYSFYPMLSCVFVDDQIRVDYKLPWCIPEDYPLVEFKQKGVRGGSIFDRFSNFFDICWGNLDEENELMRTTTSDHWEESLLLKKHNL